MADLTLSEDASALLRDAVYEINQLARVLPVLVPIDEDQAHYSVKGIGGRIVRLTSALIQGLDHEADQDQLSKIIHYGEHGDA